MEILAAILYFSQFAFSATAAVLAAMLFHHYRHVGWLLLAAAFLTPFVFLLLRFMNGRPLFTYYSIGPVVNGAAQITISYDIPGFYMIVVVALLSLIRDARRGK